MLQIKHLNQLLAGKKFLIAVGPAQPDQVVEHGIRQVAHIPVGRYRYGPVTLAETAFIGSQHHGDMTVNRQGAIQCFINEDLFGGIHHMIIAADNRIDLHGHIVDDHRKIIGGDAVAAAHNKIIQLIILKNDVAFDDIFNHRCSAQRCF